MPLFHGKSKSVDTDDKPQGRSLAMAYSMKRRANKATSGTCAHGGETTCPHCTYPQDSSSENDPTEMERMAKGGVTGVHEASEVSPGHSVAGAYTRAHKILKGSGELHRDMAKQYAKDEHKRVLGEMRADKGDRRNMAEGGMMHTEDEYDESEYNKKRPMHPDEAAMTEDDRRLGEHGEIEEGPQGTWMADGGQITDNYSDTEDGDGTDMVGRIMAQRQRMFSKGGRVANSDEVEAGFSPNEFDDLHLRDNLEQHYTGENSGDYDGNEGEDERRNDIVSRIMRSRRKGPGRNPRPA